LIRAPLSTTSVLDESAAVVRATVSPWAALLLATSIPYRFMQIVFADRLIELGSNASQYGDLLRTTADITCATFLLALVGRAIYARACRMASESGVAPGREALRVPLTAFASYVFVASIAEAATYLLFVTGLGIAFGAVLSGLAGPLRRLARFGGSSRIVASLALVFFCAFVVALLNVATLVSGIFALASTVQGWDAARWQVLLSIHNRRYVLTIIAGALLVIEPFWIAANVLLVRKAGAAQTGDDLRVWFEELQRS
jgi:hypothetical protein